MSYTPRRRTAPERRPLEIAYSGGMDFPYPSTFLLAHAGLVNGRDTAGGNAILNPDFESGGGGWEAACDARISRLVADGAERMFRNWGPKRYPDRDYGMPPGVARGFAEHAKRTAGAPLPPTPFHVNPSRYFSRNGFASDLAGMARDVDAARRAGRAIVLDMESAPDRR